MPLPDDHLFWSYRLAKFEVAGERRGLGRLAFAQYEQNLASRLTTLGSRGVSPTRLFRDVDPGLVWLGPKGVKTRARKTDDGSFVSVPGRAHDHQITGLSVRVLLEPSPDFATSEILWLRAFGPALETILAPACLGNRLDLRGEPRSIRGGGRRAYRYWAPDYRRFRQGALAEAKRLLKTGDRRCVLVALDLAAYYDNIDPAFLIHADFLAEVEAAARLQDISFDRRDYLDATAGLLGAFGRFRAAVDQAVGGVSRPGIPIGSLTARLIANLALVELDRFVASRAGVRHYTRYVDDILVVQEPQEATENAGSAAIARLLPLSDARTSRKRFVIDEAQLKRPGSSFTVQHAKLRMFDLEGEQGLEYLSAIEAEMERVSSERRRFLEPWGEELDQTVAASPNAEPIRALRDADALSLRRLAVGTVCRKVRTAAAMLNREEATRFARTYLGKVGRLATEWSRWMDLFEVSLQILGAALVSGDKETANEVIEAVLARVSSLADGHGRSFKVRWGASTVGLRRARKMLRGWVEAQLIEAICCATPFDGSGFTVKGIKAVNEGVGLTSHHLDAPELLERARQLAGADLRLVDRETDHALGCLQVRRPQEMLQTLQQELAEEPEFARRRAGLEAFRSACRDQRDPVYAEVTSTDLLLAVQPPSYTDILFRWLRAEQPMSTFLDVVNAVRGTQYPTIPMVELDGGLQVEPPPGDPGDASSATGVSRARVVLGNLCTEEAWWERSLTAPVVTVERQRRLARVLNQAMDAARRAKRRGLPTLLVLPELSLPRRWVREVCRHLIYNEPSLSLVAGLEYDVVGPNVYNEALAFLPRRFHSCAGWIWTKRRPAHHERLELAKTKFTFATRNESRRFVVISSEHGKFLPLICSELMEVDTRSRLLGRVDLVLVPAWNQDTTSFEAFVHSSTLELHSFVAVANNGVFSDCRTRGPYVDAWQRDVCRLIVRGENETIMADLPIDLLREYRADPDAYDRKRREWRKEARETGATESPCPWPAWKPVPPGMSTT